MLFLALAFTFHRRVRKAGIRTANLYSVLYTLYASSALLTVRTVYRTVEYFGIARVRVGVGEKVDPGSFGPEVRYECFFYVFEAALMLCNAGLWNFRHPRRYLPKSTKVYLSRDGVTEVTGPGYMDKRNFFVTLADPFDLVGLIKGRDKQTRFWDEGQGEVETAVADDGRRGLDKSGGP